MDPRTKQRLIVGGVIGGGLLLWMLSKASAANAANAAAASLGPAGGTPASAAGSSILSPVSLPSGIYEDAGSGTGAFYQSTLPAPTATQVAQQGSIWSNLQPTSAPASSGWVNFPSGSQAAVALLPWRTDGVNFFVQWAGVVYAVPVTTDQYGNYTAVVA